MFCPACGVKQDQSFRFCGACGVELRAATREDKSQEPAGRPVSTRYVDAPWWVPLGLSVAALYGVMSLWGLGLMIRNDSSDFLTIATWVCLLITGVWVFADAVYSGIRKVHEAKKSFFNLRPGGWAAAVLLLSIISLPAYFAKRRALIASSHASAEFDPRLGKVAYAIATAVSVVLLFAIVVKGDVPGCGSADSLTLANRIIAENVPQRVAPITQTAQVSFDGKTRICRGFVNNGSRDIPIIYRVSWHDQLRGTVYVEVE